MHVQTSKSQSLQMSSCLGLGLVLSKGLTMRALPGLYFINTHSGSFLALFPQWDKESTEQDDVLAWSPGCVSISRPLSGDPTFRAC